jgi:hypothetical protein
MTEQTATARPIEPVYDKRGEPIWKGRLSTPDDTYADIKFVPRRYIPVIFVPGVMGSNLKGVGSQSADVQWLMDSDTSIGGTWALAGADYRKRHLTPGTMAVLDSGKIPDGTKIPAEELRRRGWGEVGYRSYAMFLVWLENALNDFSDPEGGQRSSLRRDALQALHGESLLTQAEFELSYRYRFPIYACGYNWLDSNAKSAERLAEAIDAIIKRYAQVEKCRCEEVIIVTHSMGGLVTRHCAKVLGKESKILGVVHGVMPAIGAAAVYRRMKAGTDGDAGAAMVLGNDAAKVTAILSSAPGPLQLLPTPEYGMGWLKVIDGNETAALPVNDPYSEIYTARDKWWGLCEPSLINPLNKETDPAKKKDQTEIDFNAFKALIDKEVFPFHVKIAGKYHPTTYAFFGSHKDVKAYGVVTWKGMFGVDPRAAPRNPLDGQILNRPLQAQLGRIRQVGFDSTPAQIPSVNRQMFEISLPDEDGDGTVPHRSGILPAGCCKSLLQVRVEHEPAFNHTKGADAMRACRYTLRSVVRIAQLTKMTY